MSTLPVRHMVAEVTRKEHITPHYIRIYLHSDDVPYFKNTAIGDNNKILIPPVYLNEIHFPVLDENRKWIFPPKEVAPSMRTYTHRNINLERNEIVIDFVDHGDNGPASKWARDSKPGSKLGVMMRTEAKELYSEADWYLFVGDSTSIPAIAAVLETLPETAQGTCIIEVHGIEDEQILFTEADITFKWIHNPTPHLKCELSDAVKEIDIPEISKFGFVACEFSSVNAIRSYLREDKNFTQKELYAYSYWKIGVAEN